MKRTRRFKKSETMQLRNRKLSASTTNSMQSVKLKDEKKLTSFFSQAKKRKLFKPTGEFNPTLSNEAEANYESNNEVSPQCKLLNAETGILSLPYIFQ